MNPDPKVSNIEAKKKSVASKNEAKPSSPAKVRKSSTQKATTKLKAAMHGKASPAKAAEGDKPVFDNRQFAAAATRHR